MAPKNVYVSLQYLLPHFTITPLYKATRIHCSGINQCICMYNSCCDGEQMCKDEKVGKYYSI